MDKNKVEFGISNLYVGTYTVGTDGTVTLGDPYHQRGAKSLKLEPEGDNNDYYADNIRYWSGFSDNGFSGAIEVARFDDDYKKNFLGYAATATGGIASITGAAKPNVYVMFQAEGDGEARRVIIYNVAQGGINREYNTNEDKKEPTTESVDIVCLGDSTTGITVVNYKPTDVGYTNLFTEPPVPELEVAV
ncbi:MAG: major tail protein [Lentisphaeria bacterium]